MSTLIKPNMYCWLYISSIAIFIGAGLWGYPQPNLDDMHSINTAIHLADKGTFEAPMFERMLETHETKALLKWPPFHSYILASWLIVFGVSAKSLLMFQALCNILAFIGFSQILLYFGLPLLGHVALLVVLIPFANLFGLRPEMLALSICGNGLVLLLRPNPKRMTIAFAMLGASVLTIPNVIVVGTIFSTLILILLWREQKTSGLNVSVKAILGAVMCAAIINGIFFWLAIGGQWNMYIKQLQMLVDLEWIPRHKAVNHFVDYYTSNWKPILAFPAFCLLLVSTTCSFIIKSADYKIKWLITACLIGFILQILYRPFSLDYMAQFFVWLGAISGAFGLLWSKRWKPIVIACLGGAFILSQTINVISFCLTKKPDKNHLMKIKQKAIESSLNKTIVIDEWAFRYVFDYRVPDRTLAYQYLNPDPLEYNQFRAEFKKEGDVWVISRARLGLFAPSIESDYPKIHFLGRTFRTLPLDPYEFRVIP
jgi:hypothetical protein